MNDTYNCTVVTVSLRPSPISQENACFGIILKCDETGFCDYKLARHDDKVIDRIVNFFPKYGRQNLMRTMEWAAHDITFAIQGEKTGQFSFANLIRPRENVIRYGSPFAVSSADPASELDRQYEVNVAVR
jgi:hypothetical protein